MRTAATPAPQLLGRALHDASAALGLRLPLPFPAQIAAYLDELDRWQRIGSLTAYRDADERVRHLVLESLMLLAAAPEAASPFLDIGSGPGIPGLILKLARPEWDVTLVERVRRRANFLRHVVRRLDLQGVTVCGERAEVLMSGPLASRFKTVTMRAVAAPEGAAELARPFLASEGALVVPIGPRGPRPAGLLREVTLAMPGELPWRRQFLIIPRAELDGHVPRGTGRIGRAHHRGREPEGRRREDHDRREPGERAGGGQPDDAAR